jgi:cytoskeletal protein CcmA (bactofilin family)
MFGRKKNDELSDQVETLIGHTTTMKGSMSSSGALRIDGQFEGDISTTADLIIGEAGKIKATVSAKNAVVAGTVTGNMDINDKLELLSTAKVVGDLKVGALIIGEGAVFKGNCEMKQTTE